jgi:hypothetical protein
VLAQNADYLSGSAHGRRGEWCVFERFAPGAAVRAEAGEWHISKPYDNEYCQDCGEDLAHGELINIEYEGGVMHAVCSDRAYVDRETPRP